MSPNAPLQRMSKDEPEAVTLLQRLKCALHYNGVVTLEEGELS